MKMSVDLRAEQSASTIGESTHLGGHGGQNLDNVFVESRSFGRAQTMDYEWNEQCVGGTSVSAVNAGGAGQLRRVRDDGEGM